MKKITLSIFILALSVVAGLSLMSNANGPSEAASGSPKEGGNTCSMCHMGPSGSGSISLLGLEEPYEAGKTYTMTVKVNDAGRARYGFQAIALDAENTAVGSFKALTGTKVLAKSGNNYIQHGAANTNGEFTFEWTAPATSQGKIKWYVAGNAANGDGNTSGDHIYTTQVEVEAKDGGVSISEELASQISVFPNPALEGQMQVQFEKMEVLTAKILSLNGKELAHFANPTSLNLSHLGTGVYILSIETTEGFATKRIQIL